MAVREEYIRQRRAWLCLDGRNPNFTPGRQWDTGRTGVGGKRSPPVWVKIAQFLVDNEISDYPAFIRRVFEERGPHKPAPQPNHLYGPSALRIWKQSVSERELLIRTKQAWEQQKKSFAMAASKHGRVFPDADEAECLKAAITRDTVALTPLYRYCVAVGEGLPEIAEMYEQDALNQYHLSPTLYDKVWGGWIPEQLRKQSERARVPLPEGNYGDDPKA